MNSKTQFQTVNIKVVSNAEKENCPPYIIQNNNQNKKRKAFGE